ncbi:MAG: class F sortase [Anaerolineae bacterium]|nr:MAG: class F sortase [Anaerolineae bacterium]
MKTLMVVLFLVLTVLPVQAGSDEVVLEIPSLKIRASLTVVNIEMQNGAAVWNTEQLGMKVGHLQGTPWIGQGGNTVIGGHYDFPDGSPSVFYRLNRIHLGDEILIRQDNIETLYLVTEKKVVAYDDLSVVSQDGAERLTLLTCSGYDANSGQFMNRLVIIATPVAG